jgi:D-alanine-D-alanine ligase-like ATP-grasp enzyme
LGRLAAIGKPGRVVAPSCDFLRTAGWRALRDERRADTAAASWTSAVRRHIYQEIWQDAADRNGAKVETLSGDFLRIRKGEMQTVVWHHTVMLDYGVSLALALDKAAIHRMLEEAAVPMPAYARFDGRDARAGLAFLNALEGASCVVKPVASTSGGEGVTCGVRSVDDFERARLWAQRSDSHLLVEQQAFGQEYRFLFLDGELLDVLRREPPTVVGDGRSTIAELIAAENGSRANSGGWAGTSIVRTDLDCLLQLGREGLNLRSVPGEGQAIPVKVAANQNSASGNFTVDPAEISPALIADAARAARASTLRFAGVEVITRNPGASLADAGGMVVEVNGTPGLHHHYLVADPARATPVAVPLLAALLDPSRSRGFAPRPH